MLKAIDYSKNNLNFLSKKEIHTAKIAPKQQDLVSGDSLFKEIKENPLNETHLLDNSPATRFNQGSQNLLSAFVDFALAIFPNYLQIKNQYHQVCRKKMHSFRVSFLHLPL